MPPKKINPIAEKLTRLINSGKMTKEKICVASDLKYPTLENVFIRSTVSYATLRSLKFAGIITDRDEVHYREWLAININKSSKRKGRAHVEETPNNAGKSEKRTFDDEGDDESEIFDSK